MAKPQSRVVIGIGSNTGDREEALRSAIQKLRIYLQAVTVAPWVESVALLPEGAPADWDQPYCNSVAVGSTDLPTIEVLPLLKKIERELGRDAQSARWSPRPIDLDLLAVDSENVQTTHLNLPHPQSLNRSFVLSPWLLLKHDQQIFGDSVLSHRRRLKICKPLIMGIVNVTPDSFSDGGEKFFEADLIKWWEGLSLMDLPEILDLGAQSTRPGATMVSVEEEILRLSRALKVLQSRPELLDAVWLSVDTFRPQVASWAIEQGVQMINDVGGLDDIEMQKVARASDARFVFMHQLGLPANREQILPPSVDPVHEVLSWGRQKINRLLDFGVARDQLFFDPGLGFGKSAAQSWQIIKRCEEFKTLPVPVLMGHSRKSSLKSVSKTVAKYPDGATLAVSLELARKGVEILRVHDFANHRSAFMADERGSI